MTSGKRPFIVCAAPFVPCRSLPHAGGQYLYKSLATLTANYSVAMVTADRTDVLAEELPHGLQVVQVPERGVTVRGAIRRLRQIALERRCPARRLSRPNIDEIARDRRFVQAIESADMFEIHWIEYFGLAEVARRIAPDLPIVGIHHEGASRALARMADLPGASPRAQRHVLCMQRNELALLGSLDEVAVFGEYEAADLRALGYRGPLRVLSPWIEPNGSNEPSRPIPDRKNVVLFVAAFDRPENQEAARWLTSEIWPRVRERVDASLILAGARPPRWLRRLDGRLSIVVTGYVPNLEPYYRRARVCVAPLMRGGGIQFKVPQALAYGVPVVGTTTSWTGLTAPQELAIVANTTGDFAGQIIDLLINSHRHSRLSDLGRSFVDTLGNPIDETIQRVHQVIARATHQAELRT